MSRPCPHCNASPALRGRHADQGYCLQCNGQPQHLHHIATLRDALTALLDEHLETIESEYGTGKPNPRFHEEWPAIAPATALLHFGWYLDTTPRP